MDIRVGKVTHYYNRIGVAVLELEEKLRVGDWITILGKTTDFEQVVGSMEIDHRKVIEVNPGMDVALKVDEPVRERDEIFITRKT